MIKVLITLVIWISIVILITGVIAYIANIAQDYYDEHRSKKKNKKLDNNASV